MSKCGYLKTGQRLDYLAQIIYYFNFLMMCVTAIALGIRSVSQQNKNSLFDEALNQYRHHQTTLQVLVTIQLVVISALVILQEYIMIKHDCGHDRVDILDDDMKTRTGLWLYLYI